MLSESSVQLYNIQQIFPQKTGKLMVAEGDEVILYFFQLRFNVKNAKEKSGIF
jgi:hypothetical protein